MRKHYVNYLRFWDGNTALYWRPVGRKFFLCIFYVYTLAFRRVCITWKYSDKWDIPWYTTRKRDITILYHAIENTETKTLLNFGGNEIAAHHGEVGSKSSNIRRFSCILIDCIFCGMVENAVLPSQNRNDLFYHDSTVFQVKRKQNLRSLSLIKM